MTFTDGAHVSFLYKGKELHGTIITHGKDAVTIKLDSGYNIVAKPAEFTHVTPLETQKAAPVKAAAPERAPDPRLPEVAILHTGGTIASKVDYATGAVIAKFTADDILNLFPELQRVANVRSRLVANIQSEMMRFGHWNLLARAVQEEADKGAKGVIITHGTDVLAQTAAALSFALESIAIPVLLVGSQRSSDRPSSDAVSNILCAARFAAHGGFSGVAICMHAGVQNDDCVVLPACRTRKMHTSRRDAFHPVNDEPYARVSYPALGIEQLRDYPSPPAGKLVVRPFDEKLKVGLHYAHPHMHAQELLAYKGFDGLVLALLGIGHAPTMATDEHNAENTHIYDAIKQLAHAMPVVGAPQTIFGRLNMNVYSPGRQLIDAGVLGQGTDVCAETAFVKLAWLLSNFSTKEIPDLYAQNLRGEFNERILP